METFSNRYLTGHVCRIELDNGDNPVGDVCSVTKKSRFGESPIIMNVDFTELAFIQNGIDTNIILSFSTPL